ncbi:MAG: tRNA-dihydrouridine synthase family protein [Candidatus Cellulosilyticum pullistercoris]|uniref:tRNA-dihydrouridine synthase n=1 Tax=Candidatus Cellulosilyticum pullistercoris TaxID=2838521 RepID=A0A9E2K7P8_9FIRM|nr:tRNA-dihydrouridine synthase family protein [Candidatus Cellulosilyticum pullistercoris]
MKFYFAPMEGITGYIYRNAHAAFFGDVDKYFTPFIAANQFGKLSTRELHDILPEHNEGIVVVPQILTNNAEDFIRTSKTLKAFGYNEVNLNLGCPSGTVVSKNKGSGFLSQREALDQFLEAVFSEAVTKISVKTRIGKDAPEEFYELIKIFNKYPMEELMIHPRIQKDYYKNKPNMDVFKDAIALSKNPVCYNGDIFTAKDYERFSEGFQDVNTVMLGRGLIANPGLVGDIKRHCKLDKQLLRAFHDRLYEGYQDILSGERNVLFKMKEAWFYMIYMFEDYEKHAKKIRKSQRLSDYEKAVASLFEERELLEGAGLFSSVKKS